MTIAAGWGIPKLHEELDLAVKMVRLLESAPPDHRRPVRLELWRDYEDELRGRITTLQVEAGLAEEAKS